MHNDGDLTDNDRALKNLRSIPEVESHHLIYQPLLSQMGFDNIVYTHGPAERGKDFIFTHLDIFGDSVLGVCQIKNEKITGKSSSDSSAIAVLGQMEQCLHTVVLNPATNCKELPQEVILFSTYDLPDAALADMSHRLEQIRKHCKIVGPSQLLGLVKKYLPEVYAELAYPGEGISRAILRYVKSYKELSAFGVREERELSNFFVNLGLSHDGSSIQEIAKGREKVLPHGKQLKCSAQFFLTIDSLARSLTERFNLPNYFTIVETVYPKESDLWKNMHPTVHFEGDDPEDDNQDDFLFDENTEVNETDEETAKRNDLAAIVTFEVGHFDHILDSIAACSNSLNKKNAEVNSELMENYIASLIEIEILLQLMKSHFADDWIAKVKDSEKRKQYKFQIDEVMPQIILNLPCSISLVGEAGAGKTSLSRILTEEAIRNKTKCVYFPCLKIQSSSASLSSELGAFLKSINALPSNGKSKSLLAGVKLIILDGCDEAATFTSRLKDDIRSLQFGKPQFVDSLFHDKKPPYVPYDIADRIKITRPGKNTLIRLNAFGPITESEHKRIIGIGKNKKYIDAFNSLYEKVCSNSIRLILTTRNSEVLKLSRSFAQLAIVPFDDKQLDNFFRNWFGEDKANYSETKEFLKLNPHIQGVCRNPMMATLVAALKQNGYALPHSRTEIYEKRFHLLMEGWDKIKDVPSRSRLFPNDKLRLLSRLALSMHNDHTRTFTKNDLKKIWTKGFEHIYPYIGLEGVIWELQYSSNLIYYEGREEYSLGHLSYQEFLTAKCIVLSQDLAILKANFSDPWWSRVLVFYSGIAGDIKKLLLSVQSLHPFEAKSELLSEMMAEARHTPADLKHFIADLQAEEHIYDDYPEYSDDEEDY